MSSTPVVDKLREELKQLGINPKEKRSDMEKQLKRAKKKELEDAILKEIQLQIEKRDAKPQPFDYYLIFDVEGTCEEDSGFDYPSEIIEFPVILVNSKLEKIDVFHRYVKPVLNPNLSDFCKRLTGISQQTVEQADTFDVVFHDFLAWLSKHCIDFNECIFVSDGPWDLRDFIEKELTYYQIKRPKFMYSIIDIRKVFQTVHKKGGNLQEMLTILGWEFQGNPHSGIDDTVNICRIFIELAKSYRMEATTNLRKHKAKKGAWFTMRKETTLF
jgi:3'-5' exoribonuclease 1